MVKVDWFFEMINGSIEGRDFLSCMLFGNTDTELTELILFTMFFPVVLYVMGSYAWQLSIIADD